MTKNNASGRPARRALGLLILRVGAGLMMMGHGLGKVQGVLAGDFHFPDPLGIGPAPSLILTALAEFVFAFLVVIGFKVRWTAIPPLIAMLVAALVFHRADGWEKQEFPLLYALVFLALIFTGSGRYSADRWLRQRRRQK